MVRSSTFLTIILFMSSSLTAAVECEEVELGKHRKKHWEDSFGDGVRGALVEQIQKKDDLFESLVPEFEFTLSPYTKLDFNYSRKVKDNLPLPVTGKISPTDLFSIQVKNALHIQLGASAKTPYAFAGVNVGIDLTHTSYELQGEDLGRCEVYSKIIDSKIEQGRKFLDAVCSDTTTTAEIERTKMFYSRYYENVVNFFSRYMSKGLNYFVDTEKNAAFAKDPLAPLKLHSMLGVPLDPDVFLEKNTEVLVGDIIEHTSFVSLTPLGLKVDIFEFLRPSYSKYYRSFRTLAFKKLAGNKIEVEVEDTVTSGNSTEFYRVKPKLWGFIKMNFGAWKNSDFKEEKFIQSFIIDLHEDLGKKFFKKILFSAYSIPTNLEKDSIVIDHTPYASAVHAKLPIYSDGDGFDHNLVFAVPSVLKYQSRNYKHVNNITHDGKEYSSGHNIQSNSFKNKLAFKIAGLGPEKVNRNFGCTMKISANAQLKKTENSSLAIRCDYYNRYAQKKNVLEVKDFINTVLTGKMKKTDVKKLVNLKHPRKNTINMQTKLSFNKQQILKIINTPDNEIYHTISKLMFGNKSANVFAKKHHHIWRHGKVVYGRKGVLRKSHVRSRDLSNCAEFFEATKITDNYHSRYENFDGIVGRGKGIDAYKTRRCYQAFRLATFIVKNINSIRKNVAETQRIDSILDLHLSLQKQAFLQSTFVKLAGGLGVDGARFTYSVGSPYLDEIMTSTNGADHEVKNPLTRKSLSSQAQAVFHRRLEEQRVTYNTCQKNILMAHFTLNYEVANREQIFAKFAFTKYSELKDELIEEQTFRLDEMIKTQAGEYIARIELEKDIDPNVAHTFYFQLENKGTLRLSKEYKIYLKKIDVLLNFFKGLKSEVKVSDQIINVLNPDAQPN